MVLFQGARSLENSRANPARRNPTSGNPPCQRPDPVPEPALDTRGPFHHLRASSTTAHHQFSEMMQHSCHNLSIPPVAGPVWLAARPWQSPSYQKRAVVNVEI